MRKTSHIKLFEEIGFNYTTKQTPSTEDEQLSDVIKPFSIDSLEGTFKRLSKIAFEAGRNTKVTFDDFWAQTWNTGQPKREKVTLAKEPIGFKKSDVAPIENKIDIENNPRRIGPKRIPKRPVPQRRSPGRPGNPEEEPMKTPGSPRRKGIWFEEE